MIDREDGSSLETFKPSYELGVEGINLLTSELLDKRVESDLSGRRFITVEIDGKDRFSNIGRFVEKTVFDSSFGNDAEQMDEEYGPYENASIFFLSIDQVSRKSVGVMRVIGNSEKGLKTINDAKGEPFNVTLEDVVEKHRIDDLNKVWDVGTVAVLPEYRGTEGGLVSIQLYRTLYLSSLTHDIEHWVSIVDNKLLRMLQDFFAMPFVQLADSQPGPYLGSEKSHAVYSKVSELFDSVEKRMQISTNPRAKKILERLIGGEDDSSIILG